MANKRLCPGSKRPVLIEKNPADHSTYGNAWIGQWGARPVGIKRKRLECPRCHRRMMSSVSICHDGCCILHYLPPHKPKEWWKRRRKRKPRRADRVFRKQRRI